MEVGMNEGRRHGGILGGREGEVKRSWAPW
jgi:hypothetical protein